MSDESPLREVRAVASTMAGSEALLALIDTVDAQLLTLHQHLRRELDESARLLGGSRQRFDIHHRTLTGLTALRDSWVVKADHLRAPGVFAPSSDLRQASTLDHCVEGLTEVITEEAIAMSGLSGA